MPNNTSIGVACNFWNEVNALPGFLEAATRFFDDILMVDCGPNGKPSTDGSLDILRKWGVNWLQWRIDEGYGKVRTQLIHTSKTQWTVIMDADERMLVTAPVMRCTGDYRYRGPGDESKPSDLKVEILERAHNHRDCLMSRIQEADNRGIPSVRCSRRHWFDFTMRRPCENWSVIRDYQLRVFKSVNTVGFRSDVRMHEQAWDWARNASPAYIEDDPLYGPFFDHFHLHFKPMEPEQRQTDIKVYNALDSGRLAETWNEIGVQ